MAKTKKQPQVYRLVPLGDHLQPLTIGGIETEFRTVDDVMVVRIRGRVREWEAERVRTSLSERFPGHTIVVMDEAVGGLFRLEPVEDGHAKAEPDTTEPAEDGDD